ncbi:hypothetical protein BGZ54_002767 [Gamsiella multidivaricata]|nr:hypothetical protein BGZ54_002767 [Gamsiella multidivaricata]
MAGMCTGIGAKCPATNKNSCLKHSASATPSNTTESKAGGSCESSLYSARDLQCQALSSGGFNFTTACAKDTLSCQISCTDPKGGSRDSARCMQFTTHFSDGTECGQDGVCTNGTCIEKAPSFFKKNILAFAIGGTSIAFALLFCFASICFLRRRRRIREETAKKREDAYPMSESINRRSNIRIGLDPSENGLVATLPAYEPKSAFTRRSSAGIQGTLARSANAYSPDALLTEQEMVQDLAVNSYPELNPSTSSWPTAPIPVTPAYRNPSPGNTLWKDTKSGSTLQKSISVNNHVVYVPPPLPSVTLTSSPKTNNMPSPYADEAMNVFSSDSPPLSPLLPVRSKAANINIIVEKFRKETVQIDEASDSGISTASYNDEYESSILRLDSTLTMDRYNENIANNRTSVSSFFSTLAIDSEPVPVNRPPTPPLPEASFASEEYIMPAPVARVTTISTSRAPKAPSPSSSLASSKLSPSLSNKKKSAYERKQEEIKVAECFAQDLGFDIVNPSPMASPRHGISRTTADQQRIV